MLSLHLIPFLVGASPAATLSAPWPRHEGSWLEARGDEPAFDTDEGAPEDCTFWYDSAATLECDTLVNAFSVSVEDLVAWVSLTQLDIILETRTDSYLQNPSLESSCEIQPDHSYCVEITPANTPSPTGGDGDDDPTPTSTTPDEGSGAPDAVQDGIAENCDAFHLVVAGESCTTIARENGISREQLVEWNPDIGEDCTNMWADYYVCVSIEGQEAGDPGTGEPSPTGETAPGPTQPGTVENCDEFHLVEKGDICGEIVKEYDISLDDFLEWNTDVGGRACTKIWLGYYVCVGIED